MTRPRLSDEAIDRTISYASAIEDAGEVGAEVGMGFDFSSSALLSMARELKERRQADLSSKDVEVLRVAFSRYDELDLSNAERDHAIALFDRLIGGRS